MNTFYAWLRTFSFTVLLILILVCGLKIVSSMAQNPSNENSNQPWKVKKVGSKRIKKADMPNPSASTERVIEDQIPSHIPIKVELKNLDKEPLLRNLEVKVTNTSNKPIYYLNLSLMLPDVLSPKGNPIGFPLKYGRAELISFQEPIHPDDKPIAPGESFIFKVSEENLGPFERFAARNKLPLSEIKQIYLMFHLLNFGDKTGFSDTGGSPIPVFQGGKR